MNAPTSRAVFLSYASQDAETARKICEVLRAGGVEVWFDKNELRGGDAWDAKIKQQIRDCALFVPIISATTQARAEGYFRREWHLAAERTHDMADDVPFLLPMAIDGIASDRARVPEKFLMVHWMSLTGQQVPSALVQHVQALLAGAIPRAGQTSPKAQPGSVAKDDKARRFQAALQKLAALDPRKAELVRLHLMARQPIEDAARLLGIEEPLARRWWSYSRAWLAREMRDKG
jgi:hypothetical protein